VRFAQEVHPDVIVMDITMPRMSGLEAAQEIARLKLPARVLIVTMHESKSLAPSVHPQLPRRFPNPAATVKSRGCLAARLHDRPRAGF
jgi:CheY-like chemotaxis protein